MSTNTIAVQCYLYRDSSKMWTARSGDITDLKVSCFEPEDTLKRCQSVALESLSRRVMNNSLSGNNLQVSILVNLVSEAEANRILGEEFKVYEHHDY